MREILSKAKIVRELLKGAKYSHFLGLIIISSKKESVGYIVGGQQRLTSLTLLEGGQP